MILLSWFFDSYHYILLLFTSVVVMFLFSFLIRVLSYSISLYVIVVYLNVWAISFNFVSNGWRSQIQVYLLLGLVFWFVFAIIKKVVSFLSFPFQILSLGLVGVVVNLIMFYVCQYFVDLYIPWVEMTILSLSSLFILSLIFSLIVSIVYYVLKIIF